MDIQLNLEAAVKSVKYLPNLLLPKDVAFEMLGEKEIVRTYEYFYQGLELWLEHLVLHKTLAPEAIFTNWKHFQAHAELDTALLQLATGLHPRIPWLQENFTGEDGPTMLWFYAMSIKCRNTFIESGLLGKPSLSGKVEFQLHNLVLLDRLNEHSIHVYLPDKEVDTRITDRIQFTDCPETYLAMLASDLTRHDNDFAEGYWQPYERTKRRCTRKIRSNPKLQGGILLPNGELFRTGQDKKIPPSFRKKGFGSRKLM